MYYSNHPERQIVQTADGSVTLFLPGLKEHYHSVHGALQESRHVFIDEGLKAAVQKKNKLNILEVGFGTGLNCLLTFDHAKKSGVLINYDALEPFPLTGMELSMLNYPEMIGGDANIRAFGVMHAGPFLTRLSVDTGFTLHKTCITVHEFIPEPQRYDLIYYDAFGPQVQPECWGEDVFGKLAAAMTAGGILVTYSASGSVKRALRASGFELEHPGGPPGKREMTRAFK